MNEVQESRTAAAPRSSVRKTAAAVLAVTRAAEGAAGPAAEAKPRVVKPLARNAGSLAQYKRNHWLFYADDNHEPQDFEDPAMWVAAGAEFQLHDLVDVVHPYWYLSLIAYDVGLGETRLKALGKEVRLPARDPGSEKRCPPGYEVRPGKPGQPLWLAVRQANGQDPEFIMNLDHPEHRTREIALQWLLGLAIFKVDETRYY